MTTVPTTTQIQAIARNARLVADLLDTLPEGIETPTHFRVEHYHATPQVQWLIFGEGEKEQRARAAAIIRALGGTWDKEPSEFYRFKTERNGVKLEVVVDRAEVCKRVVTGTREVTKSVPDPTAPTVEITETVEDFEWVCEPLLAEATS